MLTLKIFPVFFSKTKIKEVANTYDNKLYAFFQLYLSDTSIYLRIDQRFMWPVSLQMLSSGCEKALNNRKTCKISLTLSLLTNKLESEQGR